MMNAFRNNLVANKVPLIFNLGFILLLVLTFVRDAPTPFSKMFWILWALAITASIIWLFFAKAETLRLFPDV
jgi:hypothetical protein